MVAPFRKELHAHCYRLLGSVADADDAMQDAMLGAWRGFGGFEGRSSLRTWLYRVATNACFQLSSKRAERRSPTELRASSSPQADLDPLVTEPLFLEPYPDDPESSFEQRQAVELAFVAALQHLPATQRAALVLRDVVELSATEVAELLDSSVPAIESALQRARAAVSSRVPPRTQQAALRDLGEARQRDLVQRYMTAWTSRDALALQQLLAADVKFSMPPIPNWFDGRDHVVGFFRERVFATDWRLVPMRASGQLAFACYQGPGLRLAAINVISLGEGGVITEIAGFLQPELFERFSLPER